MSNNGSKYLYCLIETNIEKRYLGCGIEGGYPVYTIRYRDIAAVASDMDKDVINATMENCLQHEKVLFEVMNESTVLPFEFGTISPGKENVVNLLKDNYSNIKRSIRYLKDKIEMNVKALWSNMNLIFKEVVSENRDIALYKKEIEKKTANQTYENRIKIGQLVAQALYLKKGKEMDFIVTTLKKEAVGYVSERIVGDNMILNGAFLIRKGKLDKFESNLCRLDKELNGRVNFNYTGPIPPFNFTNLKLKIRE